jgi:hypothetical protein
MAKIWLLESGIQNPHGISGLSGSFNAWFDADAQRHAFAYSEITGYGITSLLYLNHVQRDPIRIERAIIAGDWLADRAMDHETGGILCRLESGRDHFVQRVCTFDNGMCLNGLVNLFRATGDKRYLNVSRVIAKWLASMQMPDGSFYPRYFVDRDQLEHQGNKWSQQPGSFHAKIAIGLLNLADVTDDDAYVTMAKNNCDWVVAGQLPDGRFVTDVRDGSSFLHPMCYTLEGLLVAGFTLKDERYVEAGIRGFNWIWDNRRRGDGFSAYYPVNSHYPVERPDVNAQVIRLYLMLAANGLIANEQSEITRAAEHLRLYQCNSDDRRINGGFVNGNAWFVDDLPKRMPKHVNAWVTMFVSQAILMNTSRAVLQDSEMFYLI